MILTTIFTDLHLRGLDFEAAVQAGKLYGDTLRRKKIGWWDTIIAAIVLLRGKRLATSNPDHFRGMPDIEVIELQCRRGLIKLGRQGRRVIL